LVFDAQPRGRCDLPNDWEIACSKRDHAKRLAVAKDPESEPPGCHAPFCELAPVFLEHRPCSVLGTAVGPRSQERALVCPVHAFACEICECRQFFIARQAEFESWCEDGQAVLWPQVSKHGPEHDDSVHPMQLNYCRDQDLSSACQCVAIGCDIAR
jgi:hypothetical protein